MEYNKNGCLEGKFDIRDFKLKKNVAMATVYPDTFECEKRVAVKNQGSVGSCVAHSMSEILEYHEGVVLSTDFIYGIHNKLYGSEGPGMYLREALKISHDYGDPDKTFCPTNTEVKKVYEIANTVFENKEAMEDASKHRVESYVRLLTTNDIKYALTTYGPVLGAVTWYDDNCLKNYVLQKGSINGGGHAIVLIGWNEQGWVCQNSWGTRWGDKGYFILPFDYGIKECYSVVPDGNKDDVVVPKHNLFLDVCYKVINAIVNFIINLFK